jgi:hypothetical protein
MEEGSYGVKEPRQAPHLQINERVTDEGSDLS